MTPAPPTAARTMDPFGNLPVEEPAAPIIRRGPDGCKPTALRIGHAWANSRPASIAVGAGCLAYAAWLFVFRARRLFAARANRLSDDSSLSAQPAGGSTLVSREPATMTLPPP